MSFFAGAGGGLLGGGLGLLGSILGGNAASDAADANAQALKELMWQRYGWGNQARARMAGEFFGGGADDFLRGTHSPQEYSSLWGTPDQRITRTVTEPVGGGRGAAGNRGRAPSQGYVPGMPGTQTYSYEDTIPGQAGMFDKDEFLRQYGGSRGIYGQLQDLAGAFGERGRGLLSAYDDDTRRLAQLGEGGLAQIMQHWGGGQSRAGELAGGLEGLAREWGVGRERLIDEDAARALRSANTLSQAHLARSGLGNSTLLANAIGGNTAAMTRQAARAKQDVGEAALDRQMGARQFRSSLADQQARFGSGLLSNWLGASMDRESQRASGRTALDSDRLNRDLQLEQMPIMTRLSLMSSPLMNPGLNIDTAAYHAPGGAGMMQSALGQWMGGVGGNIFGNWLGGQFGAGQGSGGNWAGGNRGINWNMA